MKILCIAVIHLHMIDITMLEVIVQECLFNHIFSPMVLILYVMHVVFPIFVLLPSLQYARLVREALCELELPYILQNIGEGSSRAKLLLDVSGSKEVRF